jgi:hypothetical protein
VGIVVAGEGAREPGWSGRDCGWVWRVCVCVCSLAVSDHSSLRPMELNTSSCFTRVAVCLHWALLAWYARLAERPPQGATHVARRWHLGCARAGLLQACTTRSRFCKITHVSRRGCCCSLDPGAWGVSAGALALAGDREQVTCSANQTSHAALFVDWLWARHFAWN